MESIPVNTDNAHIQMQMNKLSHWFEKKKKRKEKQTSNHLICHK